MRKNILDLTPGRVRKFFLNQEVYLNIDLPPYYRFEPIISQLSERLGWSSLDKKNLDAAKHSENVNHVIFGNKDGNYAWRKYELINPLLYISLVNTIATKGSWEIIKKRFQELKCEDSIKCVSIPVLADSNQKQKAAQINEWVNSIEKESIVLALDYEYLYQTDIVGCYSSIYTHSISWALHGKEMSKNNRNFEQLLGNKVDHHIQAMCYGQTNGIPQGSVLMDFIAEIVLAYADRELYKKIVPRLKKNDFYILRYRDDYRIFVRNPKDGDLIMRELSHVLAHLGMSLNIAKTNKSDKIIVDSIKKDKLNMLKFPLPKKINKVTLRNELLNIYELGTIYPNCGSIRSRLMKIDSRVENNVLQKNPKEIISILINIAFENPSSFPIVAALLSKAINKLHKKDKEEIFNKLLRKIKLLPNSGLMEVWLQRITIKHKILSYYDEVLCRNTNGENLEVFDFTWTKLEGVKEIFEQAKFIDFKIIKELDSIIARKEYELFEKNWY